MFEDSETTPLVNQNVPATCAPHSYPWKILPLALIVLVLDAAGFISVGPETTIFEQIACQDYYESSSTVDWDRCKVEPVQSEVAFIIAWRQSLEIIPGIICAIPLGALADRIGPKKVLLCSIIGCFLSDTWVRLVCYFPNIFPLRLVLFSGAWQFFGGGATTLSTMLWVMIANKTPAEHRSSAFAQIQATILVAEFLSVIISAPLININAWIPYLLASFLVIVGFILSMIYVEDASSKENITQDPAPTVQLEEIAQMTGWIQNHANVLLLLSSFFTIELGLRVANVLVQYASKRFSWSISHATYMIMVRSLTSLVLLLSIPFLTKAVSEKWSKMPQETYEKRSTQLSLLSFVIGSLISFAALHPVALISGQVLYGFASGFHVTARSLITAMVDAQHLGTLYGAVAVASYCGILCGAPLIAYVFSCGMRIGGIWIGLPYLVAAGLFSLTLVQVSLAKIKRPGDRVL